MRLPSKPDEWPRYQKWPPTRKIVRVLETYPPVFVLDGGKRVMGKTPIPKKDRLDPPSMNPFYVKDKKAIYRGSDGFDYRIKESFVNRTTGVPSRVDWQLVINQEIIDAIRKSFRVKDLKTAYFMITGFHAPKLKKDILVHYILKYIIANRHVLLVQKGTRLS